MIRSIKHRLEFACFCIVHRLPPPLQRRWQEKRLRHLIAYAYENVPMWNRLLSDCGLKPCDIRTLEDIRKLPITSKKTFFGKMVEDYIDSSRLMRSFWYVTSGTSGTPFTFMMGTHAWDKRFIDFAQFRFMWWLGERYSRLSTVRLARIKIRAPATENRLFVPVESYLSDPHSALQTIAEFKPEVISSYPSILLDMARQIASDPTLPRPNAKYALAFGETLFPATRKFISDTLGCEIYDRYGLEEIGAVGVECVMHNGFHINSESLIVEVTNNAYEPVQLGEEGRLIMTDLFNYGMPFIRYDTEDRGVISYEPCACGLPAPRLWIKGRYSAYLSFASRRVHHLEFDGAMDGFMNYIFQYQIAKRSDNEICARVIPGPAYHDGVPAMIKASISTLVGESIEIDVEIVNELPITPRGKSRIVIDESHA